ncbi:MAG TPA: hypothetical protein VFY23_05040 [Candidatus Limnocylindrales bacterium]|nr:hypothetical protein [Candidatus Limnocylindrales bacterium]
MRPPLLVVAAAALAVLSVAAPVLASSPSGAELAALRAATVQYHDVDAAIADGYVPTEECVSSPAGGMGYHYVNFQEAMNPASSPTKPDVLLYAPSPSGPRLVGVEWIVFDADQDMSTVERHEVLGQTLHGPMTHGLPVHYDLHAWIWQANPAGVFADFNPTVRC